MKSGYKLVALEEKAKESRKVDIMIYEKLHAKISTVTAGRVAG